MKMAPNHNNYILTDASGEPVSRTYQYRKVMKPMLERKRRARINRCLDELKELMTGAMQTEGETVAKLEKADILELTVRHLHNLRKQNQINGGRPEQTYADRFKAGFRQCAAEITQFLSSLDQNTSSHVFNHLNHCIKRLENLTIPTSTIIATTQSTIHSPSPSTSPSLSYQQSLDITITQSPSPPLVLHSPQPPPPPPIPSSPSAPSAKLSIIPTKQLIQQASYQQPSSTSISSKNWLENSPKSFVISESNYPSNFQYNYQFNQQYQQPIVHQQQNLCNDVKCYKFNKFKKPKLAVKMEIIEDCQMWRPW